MAPAVGSALLGEGRPPPREELRAPGIDGVDNGCRLVAAGRRARRCAGLQEGRNGGEGTHQLDVDDTGDGAAYGRHADTRDVRERAQTRNLGYDASNSSQRVRKTPPGTCPDLFGKKLEPRLPPRS